MRSQQEVTDAVTLLRDGLTASDVARRTGIPRSTIRDWRDGRRPRRSLCRVEHDLTRLDEAAYAYLLGMYLGDGCIAARPRGVWILRITLDSIYPGIVAECARAIEAIAPGSAHCSG